MPDASMTLQAHLGMDSAGFESGISQATSFAKGQFAALAGYFASQFTVGAIVNLVKGSLSFAHEMQANAEATGISVEQLQAFNYVALMAGSSQDKIQLAMMRLGNAQGAISNAAEGSGKLSAALGQLGVSFEQSITLDKARILELIGRKLAEGGDAAQLMNAAVIIFGERIGPNFLKMLKDVGAEGLDPLTQRLKASGAIMNAELTRQLNDANKTLEKFGQQKTIAAGKLATIWLNKAEFLGTLWSGGDMEEAYRNATASPEERALENKSDAQLRADAKKSHEAAAADTKAKIDAAAGAQDTKTLEAAGKIGAEADTLRGERLFKELSTLAQIAQVQARLQQIEQQRNNLSGATAADNELILANLGKQEEQLKALLDAAKKKHQQEMSREEDVYLEGAQRIGDLNASAGAPQAADRLAKIGGYVGGQTDPMMRIAERQLKVQEDTNRILRDMDEKLVKLESGVTE